MMPNPVKAARTQAGLTQAELAEKAQVTRQVVVLTEQGLYKQPPESVIRVLCRLDFTSHAVLLANYAGWVESQRYSHQHLFRPVDLRITPGDRWAALKSQVAGKSQQGFCRALVYQPSLVREFEKFGRGSAGIFSALRQCGLPNTQVKLLVGGFKNAEVY